MSDCARRDIDVKGDATMKPSAPKAMTWWIALVLGLLGLLGYLGNVAALSPYAFWLALAGLVLMLVATQTRNL
jgi:4-hydroxybenzoate polyprenyltransferase